MKKGREYFGVREEVEAIILDDTTFGIGLSLFRNDFDFLKNACLSKRSHKHFDGSVHLLSIHTGGNSNGRNPRLHALLIGSCKKENFP